MPAPYNYNTNPSQPFTSFVSGLESAQNYGMNAQSLAMNNQKMQAVRYAAERQARMQADFAALADTDFTSEDVTRYMARYPEISDKILSLYKASSTNEKDEDIRQTIPIASALINDRPDVAKHEANKIMQAMLNSGDEKGAKLMESIIKTIDTSPKSVLTSQLMYLKALGVDIDKLINKGGTNFKELEFRLKLADKKFDKEKILRGEYTKNTEDFYKIRDSYRALKATQPGRVGDLAMIFNFMKMLDPRSVVKSDEQASVKNAANVPERIRNLWNALLTGSGQVGPEQRRAILAQAKALMDSAKTKEQSQRQGLTRIAIDNGLDPKNLFIEEIKSKKEENKDRVRKLIESIGPLQGEENSENIVESEPMSAYEKSIRRDELKSKYKAN